LALEDGTCVVFRGTGPDDMSGNIMNSDAPSSLIIAGIRNNGWRARRVELPHEMRSPSQFQLLAADGDDQLDLMIAFASDPNGTGAAGVGIYWSGHVDMDAAEPFSFDGGAPTILRLPGQETPFSIVPLNVDRDQQLELAILGGAPGRDASVWLAQIDGH